MNQQEFLAELVKVPSDNPPGDCAPHAERAAQLLERLGFAVERHVVPKPAVEAAGMRSVTNLIVRRRYGDGPVIALNAHGDVVPPGQGWTTDPYGAEIKNGRMYGRGVAVSKSDFATYAFAILALEAARRPTRGAVELHLTYDEEAGGELGPAWLLKHGLTKPDLAIAAGFSYSVVVAHNGCLHLEVRVKGRQAHAALPSTGVDALEATTGVLRALYDYRKSLTTRSAVPGIGTPSLVVGLIKGGINTNVVPDLVTLRLDRRMIPEEDPAAAEAALRAVIAAAVEAPAAVEIERIMLARPLTQTPASERLGQTVAKHAAAVFGTEIRLHGVPLYTDARHYAEAGVPIALYGAGPRTILEANAHGADEHLVLADLERATQVVTRTLAELLAG